MSRGRAGGFYIAWGEEINSSQYITYYTPPPSVSFITPLFLLHHPLFSSFLSPFIHILLSPFPFHSHPSLSFPLSFSSFSLYFPFILILLSPFPSHSHPPISFPSSFTSFSLLFPFILILFSPFPFHSHPSLSFPLSFSSSTPPSTLLFLSYSLLPPFILILLSSFLH